jgi:stearoyl-CoA desaturase (delta-9 desaturase)
LERGCAAQSSFQTPKPVEYLFALLGPMAVQGPVVSWVADHRKHHAHTDEEGDPHSPHVGHGDGVRGMLAGLWHAHTGWLMSTQGRADWKQALRHRGSLDQRVLVGIAFAG